MLTKLLDGLRLNVQRFQELAGLLRDIVVDEIRDAEPLDVRPLEASQMNSPLNEWRQHARVARRTGDQNPGVWEQSSLEKINSVGQGSSAPNALVVTVQDEKHPIFHQVKRAPYLGDGVAKGGCSWEQFSSQVVQHGAATKFTKGHNEGQRWAIALDCPLV